MARQPDLYKLFRENQHKLKQSPSPTTWSRLEHRLDRSRQRRSFPIWRFWNVAAAMVLLTAVLVVISYVLPNRDSELMASSTDFAIESDNLNAVHPPTTLLRLVASVRTLQDKQPLKFVDEGPRERRLIARSNPIVPNYSGHISR